MPASILVVEDNQDLLFNLGLILKINNYNPILASNGKEALDILLGLESPPDIIISDIMMPEMNGYEFFKEIVSNSKWNQIPFIFLSAKTSSHEIRLGKSLGVDDYIIKPFDERDLLAVISGKILRNSRIKDLNIAVNKALINISLKQNYHNNDHLSLLTAFWDDKKGPAWRDFYPQDRDYPFSLKDIASQLFSAATIIYGYDKISKAEGLLLNIKNLDLYGYIYFDSYPKNNERFGQKEFMVAILASKISYFHSLKIKNIVKEISKSIKENEDWDPKGYWNQIKDILFEEIIFNE